MSAILVVDDEYDLLQCIRGVLEDEGYDVITSNNGREALETVAALGDKKLAMIVVDMMMPLMSGFELIARIREIDALRSVPIVMISAVDPPKGQERVWNDFLKKPFHVEALLSKVERYARR